MHAVYTWQKPEAYPNVCVVEHPIIGFPPKATANRIDIAYDATYSGGALSNFSERTSEFDGLTCNSK